MKHVAAVVFAAALVACGGRGDDSGALSQPRQASRSVAVDSNAVAASSEASQSGVGSTSGYLEGRYTLAPYGLDSIPDSAAAAVMGVPEAFVAMLRKPGAEPKPGERWEEYLPAALREHKMPVSTYEEFRRARPDLVNTPGWSQTEVVIDESPGPFQEVGGRIWFGKVFQEGKGRAGVGGVGYFDPARSSYTFLKVPEAAQWSASALWAPYQNLWIGLAKYGDDACKDCGQLLHLDLEKGTTQKFEIGDRILRMQSFNDALYLPTANGVSVVERDKLTRFAVARDSAGKLGLVRLTPMPPGPPLKTIYEQPINATQILSIAAGQKTDPQMTQLRMRLVDRADPKHFSDLATFTEASITFWWTVLRADSRSVVFSRDGDYGPDHRVKVFFDPESKKVLKRLDYSTHVGLDQVSVSKVAETLAIPESFVRELLAPSARAYPDPGIDSLLPPEVRGHPMPQSSYDDFARARPERVEDGYDREATGVGEQLGPHQRVGSRIWFGKTFYDGEGVTGVGGFGYFDIPTSRYTFLPIKELRPWSVSALLVEDRHAWIALVGHPEGADYSGGLLRYDLTTGAVEKYAAEEVVLRILARGDRVYLVTQNGLSVMDQNRLVARYVVEPDINGDDYLVPLAK